jgi:transposase
MKFVATKTVDQLDLQALHRVRERLVRQRTGIINQIRAFLLERGIAVRQGFCFLRSELPGILAPRTDVRTMLKASIVQLSGVPLLQLRFLLRVICAATTGRRIGGVIEFSAG